jgi:hypothetical protein
MMLGLAIALALQATPAQPSFEGSADLKMVVTHQGEKVDTSMRMFFTRTSWRMDTDVRPPDTSSPGARHELGGHETFRLVVFGKVSDPTKGWIVNDRTKTYAVMVVDPANRRADEDPDAWTVSRGGTDRVAGFACENVTAQRIDQSESWDACLSSELPRTAMESLNHIDAEAWIAAAHRAGVKGRPIRAISRGHDGSERSRWEYVKFERRALPKTLFEVPAGYRETSAMKAMAQSPEMERDIEQMEKHLGEMMKDMSPEDRKMMEQMMRNPGAKSP